MALWTTVELCGMEKYHITGFTQCKMHSLFLYVAQQNEIREPTVRKLWMKKYKYFPFHASCCMQTQCIINELDSTLWHRLTAATVCLLGLTVSECENTAHVRFQGFCSYNLLIHRLLSICNNGFQAAEKRLVMFVCVSAWEDLTDLCLILLITIWKGVFKKVRCD